MQFKRIVITFWATCFKIYQCAFPHIIAERETRFILWLLQWSSAVKIFWCAEVIVNIVVLLSCNYGILNLQNPVFHSLQMILQVVFVCILKHSSVQFTNTLCLHTVYYFSEGKSSWQHYHHRCVLFYNNGVKHMPALIYRRFNSSLYLYVSCIVIQVLAMGPLVCLMSGHVVQSIISLWGLVLRQLQH